MGNPELNIGDSMLGENLVWMYDSNGCIVSTSHKLNKDGYLRVRDPRYTGEGRKPLIMAHRLAWENFNGEIPDGFEVHHKCHNRACCNVDHLELVKITEHKIEHNSTRYADRKNKAKEYWESTKCTGTKLGEVFGVSFSSACRWIREWKCRDQV